MTTYMYTQIQENGGIPSRKQSNAESIENDTVETAEYGFKEQVPKVSMSKNLKIYRRGSGVAISLFSRDANKNYLNGRVNIRHKDYLPPNGLPTELLESPLATEHKMSLVII